MTTQTCLTCRFRGGRLTPSYLASDDDLRCRRYPPQFSGGKWGDIFSQPRITRGGWCGEWAERTEDAE